MENITPLQKNLLALPVGFSVATLAYSKELSVIHPLFGTSILLIWALAIWIITRSIEEPDEREKWTMLVKPILKSTLLFLVLIGVYKIC